MLKLFENLDRKWNWASVPVIWEQEYIYYYWWNQIKQGQIYEFFILRHCYARKKHLLDCSDIETANQQVITAKIDKRSVS